MTQSSTVYVIDPGRVGLLGHQYALNRMIGDHASDRGHNVCYLVDQGSPSDLVNALKARPVLDFNIYDTPPLTVADAHRVIARGNANAEKNLTDALGGIKAGDLVVFHTISYLGLLGAARWASAYAPKDIQVRVLLRFPPGYSPNFQDIPNDVVAAFEKEFAQGLRAWSALDQDVSFFGDSVEILSYLKELIGWDLPQLPTSIAFKHYTPAPPAALDGKPTFLMAGNGRKEKGVLILADAIGNFLNAKAKGRFVIQTITNPEVAERFEPFGSNVEIPNRHMEGADYFNFLATADAVLVPYDPVKYANRTSHVLIEGLGIGRPVITTAGTWMQEEAERVSPGSSLYMSEYTSDALFDCLMTFCEKREALAKLAWRQAEHVRNVHGESRFLETFLGI